MAKSSSLKSFLMKKYEKTGAVNILEEIKFQNTGIPTLNYVLSGKPLTGGVPLSGKMTVIYGPDGAGKTSLVEEIIATAQSAGIDIVYIDTERSITRPRLEQFGVDVEALTYATPEFIEEVFSVIEDTCMYKLAEKDSTPTLIVWDSVAGTPAKQTLEHNADDNEFAAESRALTRGLKRVRGKIKTSNVGVIFVNQARANMERFGDEFSMPGGYAFRHMCDMIVRVNRLKDKKRTDGQIIKISTPSKNRMFRPFQSTEVFFNFDTGFTRENIIASFVDFLVTIGLIGTSGAWCYLQSEVDSVMAKDGLSESEAVKKVRKFYRKDYTEDLIANDEEYQKLLKISEDFIQKNVDMIAERGKDQEFEGREEDTSSPDDLEDID